MARRTIITNYERRISEVARQRLLPPSLPGAGTRAADSPSISQPSPLLLATVASWSWAARAKELRPLEALSLQFGETNGVAYYTVQGPSYRVVATLASEGGIPALVVMVLLDKLFENRLATAATRPSTRPLDALAERLRGFRQDLKDMGISRPRFRTIQVCQRTCRPICGRLSEL